MCLHFKVCRYFNIYFLSTNWNPRSLINPRQEMRSSHISTGVTSTAATNVGVGTECDYSNQRVHSVFIDEQGTPRVTTARSLIGIDQTQSTHYVTGDDRRSVRKATLFVANYSDMHPSEQILNSWPRESLTPTGHRGSESDRGVGHLLSVRQTDHLDGRGQNQGRGYSDKPNIIIQVKAVILLMYY